ncbi:tRNA (adenosine(37)-N6)-threonylcarbamoyltransferase complex ATPase subunit type 1 TsaE, partial [Patescibacteria group bacterium]|nr:tRNA (adenosine(37)-N6)-threonylcarbamoyltransferase complex ATPase subunit type 1 TsaE [Patescibacteria group bacterium]
MKLRIETKSNLETVKLGRVLGEEILKNGSGNFLIALNGDLGSGKTTFIKGLGRGLGIKNKITSPTFLMVRRYSILKNKKYKNFYH